MKQSTVSARRGHRGRPFIGADSPCLSLTRSPASTPYCDRSTVLASASFRFRIRGLHARAASEGRRLMEVLYPRCAGLDVHAATVVACVRVASGATVTYEHHTVSTTTRGLLELAEWLTAHQCTHVAMEATGVYWKPVWHVLEDHLTLVLANAMHIRNSFVPPAPIQELRDLTRTRKQLVREVVRHTQRIQKTLEDANLKLTEVVSDILGVSGRAILTALVAGETDPERLADLSLGRLQTTRAQLVEALHGRVTAHHRFMLKLHLAQVTALETAITDLEARIGEALAPFRAAVNLLMTMPGLRDTAAAVIVAEIGD